MVCVQLITHPSEKSLHQSINPFTASNKPSKCRYFGLFNAKCQWIYVLQKIFWEAHYSNRVICSNFKASKDAWMLAQMVMCTMSDHKTCFIAVFSELYLKIMLKGSNRSSSPKDCFTIKKGDKACHNRQS